MSPRNAPLSPPPEAASDALTRTLAGFDPTTPIASATSLPAAWYTDPAVAGRERERVFRGAWHLAARADQLAAPGSFVGGVSAGLPWLVVRGDDGALRAFHNACRHKATPLTLEAGRAGPDRALTCPYHGWRYRLDGSLKSAPRMAGSAHLGPGCLGLAPMGVAVWGPFVLVHADPAAEAPALTELTARLDATGWGRLRYAGERRWTVRCNWKVFVDNYLDGGYHIAHMHPSLDAQLDMAAYRTELFDRYSIQSAPAASAGVGPERIGSGAIYAWIYPNLMVNRYGPALDTNLVLPLGPDRCEVVFGFWFDPELPDLEAFAARSMAQASVTQDEDIAVSEAVQIGMGSPAWNGGPYAPTVEQGIHHFHRLLATDLSGP